MLLTLQSKTSLFWDVLCTKMLWSNDPFSPYGNSCHLAKHFSETSVCIYYNRRGHILEGSNFHFHCITYTNRSLCVSSHIRGPRLFPISDSCFLPSCFTSQLRTALSLTTVVSCNTYQRFCFPCSPCLPSQVYLKCSFFHS